MAYLRNKKDFDTGLLLSQKVARHIKRTLQLFTLKLYKNIGWPFKVTADATDKGNTVFVGLTEEFFRWH